MLIQPLFCGNICLKMVASLFLVYFTRLHRPRSCAKYKLFLFHFLTSSYSVLIRSQNFHEQVVFEIIILVSCIRRVAL